MNSQGNSVPEAARPKPFPREVADGDKVPRYLLQLNALTIVRHLGLLLMEAQKHRGTSMAMLEGDADFESRVLHEQAVIQQLLAVIGQVNRQSGQIIPEEKWQGVESGWRALVQNWSNDTVITNFELHSHFIDQVVKLLWELVESAEYFTVIQTRGSSVAHKEGEAALLYSDQDHHRLVQVSLKLIPELLENIAKLRGLATHASVRGYCDSEARMRFSQLLQTLNLNKERLRVVSRTMQREALRAVPALPSIMLHEHRLDQLQQLVSQKIMIDGKISIKGLDVFDFATEIIEAYSQIIRDAIIAFQRRIEQGLL